MARRFLPTLLLFACVALVCTGCGSKVDSTHYDKIETGMSVTALKDLMGEPDETTGGGIGNASASMMTWKSGDKSIVITVLNDKVTAKAKNGF